LTRAAPREASIPLASALDPAEWKARMLAAAEQGPTAIEATTGMIYVLRHREVEHLLHEPRLRGIGLSLFDHMGIADGPLRDWYGSLMFTNDGPRHDRLRRLVSKAFTPRAVGRLRPIAAALVAERLATVRGRGGGDLVAAFAGVPMHVMCALLGVPPASVPDFVAWVDALSPVFGIMDRAQIEAATAAVVQLLAYVRELVADRAEAPADDLLSSLVRAEPDGDRLTRDETVAMVANLLVGGHDTTASQIGCTALTLLVRPHALEALRAEPDLLSALVNETIRFEPSILGAPRTVAAPLEIAGVERPAGAVVMCSFLTANRDAEAWRDPNEFAVRRFTEPGTPPLLSFGGGPHFCLGAALARMTLEEVVRGLAAVELRLAADPDELAWVQSLGRSPARLPVEIAATA
jgi:cytochrome P450